MSRHSMSPRPASGKHTRIDKDIGSKGYTDAGTPAVVTSRRHSFIGSRDPRCGRGGTERGGGCAAAPAALARRIGRHGPSLVHAGGPAGHRVRAGAPVRCQLSAGGPGARGRHDGAERSRPPGARRGSARVGQRPSGEPRAPRWSRRRPARHRSCRDSVTVRRGCSTRSTCTTPRSWASGSRGARRCSRRCGWRVPSCLPNRAGRTPCASASTRCRPARPARFSTTSSATPRVRWSSRAECAAEKLARLPANVARLLLGPCRVRPGDRRGVLSDGQGRHRAAAGRPRLDPGDVDVVVPTGVSRPSWEILLRLVGIPADRLHAGPPSFGHTITSDSFIYLQDLRRCGRVARGSRVLLFTYGFGSSWCALLLEH